jgi:hypothetical protein
VRPLWIDAAVYRPKEELFIFSAKDGDVLLTFNLKSPIANHK